MEALSSSLQPYKSTVGTVASVVTIAQFFAGAFICKDVYNQKSTKGISAMPFIGGIVIAVLMLKYGLMLQDSAMLVVNIAAIGLNAVYIVFYYIYSVDKWSEVHKPSALGSALVAVLLSYVSWEDPALIEYRFGMIVTVLMLLLLGSPLLELKEMIEKKDASSIPFPIVFMATIVTFLWLLYGIILLNDFMLIQNSVGLVLCLAQLILYFMYPKKPETAKKSSKKLD